MVKQRSLLTLILLSIVTFGIYPCFWISFLARDVNKICEGDGKKTRGFWFYLIISIITFGIYGIVWMYMLGDRLQDNGPKYNVNIKEGGGIIVLWSILGSFIVVGPYIALHIIIKNTNALAVEYNKKQPA